MGVNSCAFARDIGKRFLMDNGFSFFNFDIFFLQFSFSEVKAFSAIFTNKRVFSEISVESRSGIKS